MHLPFKRSDPTPGPAGQQIPFPMPVVTDLPNAAGDAPPAAMDIQPGAPDPVEFTVTSSAETGAILDVTSDDEASGGVHAITKTTDYWFERTVAMVEKKAVEEAEHWATAGLPRHDLRMEEPLPVETTLGTLCVEVYLRWIERVKTKVQDAIEDSGQHAREGVAQLRFHLGSMSIAKQEIARAEQSLREVERENEDRQVRFGYRSLLPKRYFLLLLGFLTMVDWIANVPIFTELLPQEPGAAAAWSSLVENSAQYGLGAGAYRLLARIAFSPEVTLLALGVIVFLMFLCHALGDALRGWWTLRGEARPRAQPVVNGFRRQRLPLIVGSVLGILLVLGALGMSRLQIKKATVRRFETAQQALGRLHQQQAQAQQRQDAQLMISLPALVSEQQSVVDELGKRAEYAAGIADMNWPVFFLNLVLVIAATVASYLHASAAETNELGPDPRLPELTGTLVRLRDELAEHRRSLHKVDVDVHAHVARLNYLLRSDPLHGWEGKTERLRRVIPLFRAENARRRGLDPASIASFQRPFMIDLPDVPRGQFFTVPSDLDAVLREFHELRPHAARAERGSRHETPEESAA